MWHIAVCKVPPFAEPEAARRDVRDHLRTTGDIFKPIEAGVKRIASFRIGRYGEGDGGVTVVELK